MAYTLHSRRHQFPHIPPWLLDKVDECSLCSQGEKYVSLLLEPEDEEARLKVHSQRQRLRALVRRQQAEAALLADADEGLGALLDEQPPPSEAEQPATTVGRGTGRVTERQGRATEPAALKAAGGGPQGHAVGRGSAGNAPVAATAAPSKKRGRGQQNSGNKGDGLLGVGRPDGGTDNGEEVDDFFLESGDDDGDDDDDDDQDVEGGEEGDMLRSPATVQDAPAGSGDDDDFFLDSEGEEGEQQQELPHAEPALNMSRAGRAETAPVFDDDFFLEEGQQVDATPMPPAVLPKSSAYEQMRGRADVAGGSGRGRTSGGRAAVAAGGSSGTKGQRQSHGGQGRGAVLHGRSAGARGRGRGEGPAGRGGRGGRGHDEKQVGRGGHGGRGRGEGHAGRGRGAGWQDRDGRNGRGRPSLGGATLAGHGPGRPTPSPAPNKIVRFDEQGGAQLVRAAAPVAVIKHPARHLTKPRPAADGGKKGEAAVGDGKGRGRQAPAGPADPVAVAAKPGQPLRTRAEGGRKRRKK